MRLRTLSTVALLFGAASYLSACAPVATPAPPAATATVAQALCALGYSSIPLRTLPTGHHLTQAIVNGSPATFVVDSGAGRTVIHRPYAETFGLTASGGPRGTAIGAGGAGAVNQVHVNDFTVATMRTSLNRIFAMDLSHVLNALDPIVGSPVHGIIGQDIMQAQHAIIDVQRERLYLKALQGDRQVGC
jgi:predicted aspartyl protease